MSNSKRQIDFNHDGADISILKMNVEPASLIFTKLKKMLGGSILNIGTAAAMKSEDESERQVSQLKAMAAAIDDIAKNNSAVDIHNLWKDILCSGYVYINRKIVTDLNDFPDLDLMYACLGKALALNYGEFLKKLLSLMQVKTNMMTQANQ